MAHDSTIATGLTTPVDIAMAMPTPLMATLVVPPSLVQHTSAAAAAAAPALPAIKEKFSKYWAISIDPAMARSIMGTLQQPEHDHCSSDGANASAQFPWKRLLESQRMGLDAL